MAKKTTTKAKTKTAKKPTSTKRTKQPVTLLRTLYRLTLIGSILAIVVTWAFMAATYFSWTVRYLTTNPLADSQDASLVSAERILMDIDLRVLLAVLLGVSAVYSLLLLTRWRSSYEKAMTKRVYVWRWVYLAVTMGLLTSVVAMLSGISDVAVLKLISGIVVIGFGLAWLSERQNEKARKFVPSAYILSVLAVFLPWLLILFTTLATTLYGFESLAGHVYAVQGIVLIGLVLLFANLWLSNRRRSAWKDYAVVERNYILIAYGLQFVSVAVLIAGFTN
ncbi:MAG: hypothetical protein U5K77_00685 [Candidatus Saccharibacteria bacterium]|nr:hypothetical protein [Candidatus Saccharibacteria bacterium]